MDSDSDGEDLRELCKLHNAAEAGDEEAVQGLIQETRERAEAVAAQLAANEHTLASPEATAQMYVDQIVNGAEIDGLTPLHLALCNEILLAHGADTKHSCEGSFPQHIVASLAALPTFKDTCTPAMQLLLDQGLSPFQEDDNGRTALHWAAASDHPQICRQLISAAQKQVAAAAAATAHHPSTTSIDSEDPRSHASVQERASMHDISGSWDVDASPVPLNRGGCTSIGGVHNMSPGAAAAASANAPKPLICLPDDRGNTAVHIAARDACCNALNELLVAVASHTHAHHAQHTHDHADAVTGASEASGSHASDAQHDHSVLLIKNKAGQTALHCAVLGGSAACISALVAAAPVTTEATDRLGATPRQVAIQRGCSSEILATLGPHACEGAAANSLSRAHAEGGCMGAPAKGGSAPMLLVTSPDCLAHHTAKPPVLRGVSIPPENIRRLEVLVDRRTGILRSGRFSECTWAEDCHPVAMTDVLRVHAWKYVKGVREACALAPEDGGTSHIDSDTAVSRGSFRAALKAAGSVCAAVDEVVAGRAKRAFCAVRPPGHHSGPFGMVPGRPGMPGSHGFCLLNNISIGAAYALSTHRHAGIRRVALLDFDVHHGNGTEECVFNTVPHETARAIDTAFSDGVERFQHWRPWFDGDDRRNILFASVQGYGPRSGRSGPPSEYIYPGSGVTADNAHATQALADHGENPEADMCVFPPKQPPDSDVPEDVAGEFSTPLALSRPRDGPRVINVGIPGPGVKANLWRRSWRDKILPAVVNFAPDLILISAGFDAHRKDDINFNFVGVREHDYAWVTEQIVQVANRVCGGRVVSVLEGGYRVQGQVVSAFARSVAAHVGALAEPNAERWSVESAAADRDADRRERERRQELKERRAQARMHGLGGFSSGLGGGLGGGFAAPRDTPAEGVGAAVAAHAADCEYPDAAGAAAAAGVAAAGAASGDEAAAAAGSAAAAAAAAGAAAALSSADAGASEVEKTSMSVDAHLQPIGELSMEQSAPDKLHIEASEGGVPKREFGSDPGLGSEPEGGLQEDGAPRSKRRRGPAPDYVTLNKQLDQAGSGGGGDGAGGSGA